MGSFTSRYAPAPRSCLGSARVYFLRACGANPFAHTMCREMGLERSAIMRVGDSRVRVAAGIEEPANLPGDFEVAFAGG